MKRIILILISCLSFASVQGQTYVYHEGRETVSHVLALNFESNFDLSVGVLRDVKRPFDPDDVVMAVGLSSFKTVCEQPNIPNVIAVFVGEEEFYSAAESCIGQASAVFSGAPVALRLQVLNSFWEGRSPIAFIYSKALPVQTEAIRVEAERLGRDVKFVPVEEGRAASLRSLSSALEESDLVMSAYDSELFDSQFSKDAIRLMFQKKKLFAAHSLQLVKAGALFALYSSTSRKLEAVADQLQGFEQSSQLPPPAYPAGLQVVFNPYLIRMYGLVLPTDAFLLSEFGVCPESGCEEPLY